MVVSLPVRSPVQSPVQSTLGRVSATFLDEMLAYGAIDAWDFTSGAYLRSGTYTGNPGLTVTRASEGYAETSDGRLVKFGSGVLRRTDKGILVEGARTNLALRSQEFDDAAWSKTNATVTADAIVAPDGTTTVDLLTSTTAGTSGVQQNYTGTAAAYAHYIIAKAGNASWVRIATTDTGNTVSTWFDLTNGVVGTNGAGHTSRIVALADGFYLCECVRTMTASTHTFNVRLAAADNNTNASSGQTLYLWHAQVELGAFGSSPIPTAASTVTRAADVLTIGSVTGLDYPLSLTAEFERVVDTGAAEHYFDVAGTAGSNNNRTSLFVAGDDVWQADIVTTSQQAGLRPSGSAAINTVQKFAARAALDDARAAANGTLSAQDTAVTLPTAPTIVYFGQRPDGALKPFSYLRRAAIIPSALTDAQLQAITS